MLHYMAKGNLQMRLKLQTSVEMERLPELSGWARTNHISSLFHISFFSLSCLSFLKLLTEVHSLWIVFI